MRNDMRLWGLWLFSVLIAVGVAQMAGFSYNEVDSSAVIIDPSFEPGRFLDVDYYREIDSSLENNLAIRGLGLRARVAIDWELLGDSTTTDVVAGVDGWLFLAEYLDPDCDAVSAAAGFADFSAEADELAVLLARPKAAFHGVALPSFGRDGSCVEQARTGVDEALGSRSVEIEPGLRALVDAGGDAFLREDTHWSPAARLVVAEAIVEHFAPGLWDSAAVVDAPVPRLAVLRRFLGEAVAGEMDGHEVGRPVRFDRLDVGELFAEPLLLRQASTSAVPDVIPGVTYIIGDSQMGYVVPLIESYFEELHFVNWIVIELGGGSFEDSPDPDRILVESIEQGAAAAADNPVISEALDRLG